ncbi:MAG: hypothetical protein N2746_01055 [Deltaproteobacteria bacterium]|nr:hypothetical protein [Deltaproteobacteria bacterium]
MSTINLILLTMLTIQNPCDDDLICTEDVLKNGECKNNLIRGYCLIDNSCYKTYDVSPNGCGICLPNTNPFEWSDNQNDGLECTIDKSDENGNCLHILKSGYCLIEHRCVINKTEDINGCRICDATKSLYEWTPYSKGTMCNDGLNCTQNDHCDGNGNCIGEDYSCDDNIECTLDVCDGKGGCSNIIKNNFCFINNECFQDLSSNPDNECLYCNVLLSQLKWSYEPKGKRCDDKDSSTPFDYCDGKGNCIGYKQDLPTDTGINIPDSPVDENIEDSNSMNYIEREGCSCNQLM